ncbi:hypothetical protein EII17_05665 [Clostridiales bacterium COT073_COT-073]|nr:hypothetical protein EII17_05665 [Clostridiales bacterium COT073_COT-073]
MKTKRYGKTVVMLCLAVINTVSFSACSSSKIPEYSQLVAEQEVRDDQAIQTSEKADDIRDEAAGKIEVTPFSTQIDEIKIPLAGVEKKQIKSKEKEPVIQDEKAARQKIMKDYADYIKTKPSVFSDKKSLAEGVLTDVDLHIEYLLAKEQKTWFLGYVKERYPGKYWKYVWFQNEMEYQKFLSSNNLDNIPVKLFYINITTGMTFYDMGFDHIIRLSDGVQITYAPYSQPDYSEYCFLINGLYQAGAIEKADVFEYVLEKQDAEKAAGKLQIIVKNLELEEIGVYDLRIDERAIFKEETLIYRDPIANYPIQKITKDNAAKVVNRFLKKQPDNLFKYQNYSVEFAAKEIVTLCSSRFAQNRHNEEMFIVRVYTQADKDAKKSVLAYYAINKSGTKIGEFLIDEGVYVIVYGAAMLLPEEYGHYKINRQRNR